MMPYQLVAPEIAGILQIQLCCHIKIILEFYLERTVNQLTNTSLKVIVAVLKSMKKTVKYIENWNEGFCDGN